MVCLAFHFSTHHSARPRTELTVNRKLLRVTGEPVLQKSVEQHATLRTFLHLWVLQEDFSSSHLSWVPQKLNTHLPPQPSAE